MDQRLKDALIRLEAAGRDWEQATKLAQVATENVTAYARAYSKRLEEVEAARRQMKGGGGDATLTITDTVRALTERLKADKDFRDMTVEDAVRYMRDRAEKWEQARVELGYTLGRSSPTITEERFGYVIQSGDRYLLSPATKQWTKEKAGAYVFHDVGEANRTVWRLFKARVVPLAPKEEG